MAKEEQVITSDMVEEGSFIDGDFTDTQFPTGDSA